jgi:hypothetical protein
MHASPVRTHDSSAERLAPFSILSNKLPGNDGARRQALQVPFPRPRHRLVEVVDPKHQASFCRSKYAEVRNMHISAGLNIKTADGRCAEILRHDSGSASEKCERGREHSSIADGDEFLEAALGLAFQERHRILARSGKSEF